MFSLILSPTPPSRVFNNLRLNLNNRKFLNFFFLTKICLTSTSFHNTNSLSDLKYSHWILFWAYWIFMKLYPRAPGLAESSRISRPWLFWRGSSSFACSSGFSAHAQLMQGNIWLSSGKKATILLVLQNKKGRPDQYLGLILKEEKHLGLAHQCPARLSCRAAGGFHHRKAARLWKETDQEEDWDDWNIKKHKGQQNKTNVIWKDKSIILMSCPPSFWGVEN